MRAPAAPRASHGIVAAQAAAIETAGGLLRSGELVAFPTETVYGLGADATNDDAVAGIFAAKQRPRFNPLIVHVADLAAAEPLVKLDDRVRALVHRFWPGPLTLVLPRRDDAPLSLLVSAGLDTVAVRAPAHAVAQALLRATGRPIAAPSANVSGRISPTTAAHVLAEMGEKPAMILDGGPCAVGVESSIVDLSGDEPRLLRPGGLAKELLETVLGPLRPPPESSGGAPRSPGLLPRHYAPSRPLRLNAMNPGPGEVLLAFGPPAGMVDPSVPAPMNLSGAGDVVEAAANLFAMLRALDQAPGYTGIAVAPIPERGLGCAINDRLRRAAAPGEDEWNDDRGAALPCVLPELAEDEAG